MSNKILIKVKDPVTNNWTVINKDNGVKDTNVKITKQDPNNGSLWLNTDDVRNVINAEKKFELSDLLDLDTLELYTDVINGANIDKYTFTYSPTTNNDITGKNCLVFETFKIEAKEINMSLYIDTRDFDYKKMEGQPYLKTVLKLLNKYKDPDVKQDLTDLTKINIVKKVDIHSEILNDFLILKDLEFVNKYVKEENLGLLPIPIKVIFKDNSSKVLNLYLRVLPSDYNEKHKMYPSMQDGIEKIMGENHHVVIRTTRGAKVYPNTDYTIEVMNKEDDYVTLDVKSNSEGSINYQTDMESIASDYFILSSKYEVRQRHMFRGDDTRAF